MLRTSAGIEPATSWSPVGRASNCATEAGLTDGQRVITIAHLEHLLRWAKKNSPRCFYSYLCHQIWLCTVCTDQSVQNLRKNTRYGLKKSLGYKICEYWFCTKGPKSANTSTVYSYKYQVFAWYELPYLYRWRGFELAFHRPVSTVKVMLNWSVNLLTLFLGRFSPLLTSTCAHILTNN